MDVILEINGRDFSDRLSTYSVDTEVIYSGVLTTMDGTEHYGKPIVRDVIHFSLMPFDDETANLDFMALSEQSLIVNYTDPLAIDAIKQYRPMKLRSNLSAAFGLRSINGNRYYKGGEIILRATMTE